MKFIITRTSTYSGTPCEEAIQEDIPWLDCRTVRTLEEARQSRWGEEWFAGGTNHREEDGMVVCDANRTVSVWTMQMSLDDLPAFIKKYGTVVLSRPSKHYSRANAELEIEIYDGYRE